MKHSIEKTEGGLRVTALVDDDKQTTLLDELNKCAAGTCSCPTPQYSKLEGMAIRAQPGKVTVELTVKAGEAVDTGDIARCLDHTAKQIGI